jgi:uncharacterized hydrophobic protein (TIGR00271 family)
MLHLRVYGPATVVETAAARVAAVPGVAHITRADSGDGSGCALVTADLQPDAADAALASIDDLGIPAEDVSLLRLERIHHGPLRRATLVVWADLLGQAGEHARPVARYLVFMAAAGVIAAYGVIYANGILIVGAMAVSPDLLPITAICIGIAVGRRRLVGRAFWTLAAGLGTAGLIAGLLTVLLEALDLLPENFQVGEGALNGLTTVNSSTFVVALVAGVAGMLALETRASSSVGVAISVTTIPASAYLGVAAGMGDIGKASGALAVLGINVSLMVVGGTLTLVVQRALERRAERRRVLAEAG